MQCDELWSFVDNKGNQQWVWLAIDADTREIVGVAIGARVETAAQQLWASLPPVYRQCAVAYTDFWAETRSSVSQQTSSSRRQGNWVDQLPTRGSTTPYAREFLD